MNVYEQCPEVSNDRFLLRLVGEEDCADLLKVYSDPEAVPLFNSDNCNGDDFYYRTMERMLDGIRMWRWSYEHGWFVRWSIIDRAAECAVGTVELFRRSEEDPCAVLRLDLRSDYEREGKIRSLLGLLLPDAFHWFGCDRVLTKAVPSAGERIAALRRWGFTPAREPLTGHDGTEFGDYFELPRLDCREMTEADIALVAPFYIEYYNSLGDGWTEEIVRRRIWQVLGSPDSFCLMAEIGGEVVGFAMGRFEQFYDLTAYNLVEILIAKRWQGLGLGTALMAELERRVKAAGAALVQLMAVSDEAHERFYGRLNYKNTENLVLKGKFL